MNMAYALFAIRHRIRVSVPAVCSFAIAACSQPATPRPAPANSTALSRTAVVATLDVPIAEGKNLVFSAAFPLAWNELRDTFVGADVKFDSPSSTADALNRNQFSKTMLPEGAFVALAGDIRGGIVQQINKELNKKFSSPPVFAIDSETPTDAVVYAFLQKDAPFVTSFEELKRPIAFGATGTPVKAFGISSFGGLPTHEKMAKQVTVYEDRNPPFTAPEDRDKRSLAIIRIETQSKKDELVLARLDPKPTLIETVQFIDGAIKKSIEEHRAHALENHFCVPEIDISVAHTFTELIGKTLLAKAPDPYRICSAQECIQFGLNKGGAFVKSEVLVGQVKAMPSNLHFNTRFLVWLRVEGQALPYFVVWVDNPEILVAG